MNFFKQDVNIKINNNKFVLKLFNGYYIRTNENCRINYYNLVINIIDKTIRFITYRKGRIKKGEVISYSEKKKRLKGRSKTRKKTCKLEVRG